MMIIAMTANTEKPMTTFLFWMTTGSDIANEFAFSPVWLKEFPFWCCWLEYPWRRGKGVFVIAVSVELAIAMVPLMFVKPVYWIHDLTVFNAAAVAVDDSPCLCVEVTGSFSTALVCPIVVVGSFPWVLRWGGVNALWVSKPSGLDPTSVRVVNEVTSATKSVKILIIGTLSDSDWMNQKLLQLRIKFM